MSVMRVRISIAKVIGKVCLKVERTKDDEQPVAHDQREQQGEKDLMRRDRGLEEFKHVRESGLEAMRFKRDAE